MCQTYRPLRPPLERNGLDGEPGLVAHISQYTYILTYIEPPTGRCTYLPPRAREVDGAWVEMEGPGGAAERVVQVGRAPWQSGLPLNPPRHSMTAPPVRTGIETS